MFSPRNLTRLSTPLRRCAFHTTARKMGLTTAQTEIVKSTAPILQVHGETITALFYKNMIGAHPELRNVFNLTHQRTGAQPKALASSVLAYATYIDKLEALGPAVERIAQKHVSLGITPEQYDIVGKYLMEAIGAVLGDGLTPEVADAWTAAYGQLAGVFIKREDDLYREAGDWPGWRSFRVARREKESDTITSFYLTPADGKLPLPAFRAGQYISIRLMVPELGVYQARQYSMSQGPDVGTYRISVKREPAPEGVEAPGGLVSGMLHDNVQVGDEVDITIPRGEFFIDVSDASKADAPLVLISAGVGVTPLVSILNAVLGKDSAMPSRPIRWLHASRNSNQMSFHKAVRAQAAEHSNIDMQIFLDQVSEGDVKGQEYDHAGRFDVDTLDKEKDLALRDPRTEYYVCGPAPWMLALRTKLEAMGVERQNIKMELFGTGTVEDNQ
ncbi:hemoglobin [Plectosphaerella plurivora]|uniref:nitric oxide dioxygenase n=1 Tax=Plectosphaerella plurivora TaxID=936078 RepID=A0A9P9AGK6_9PEZI|nr:hemoglobin [Plectosphaerella plurivora]